ncbi:hypothetical protein B7L70_03535 [Vulcanisaeta sp. EB80]|uniref:hypothetical protein n=1 Tax=Vulcanisaeta sp. EB80 TaxID=1650660 RepID=UPI0009C14618|nr:hypothetical protein [Vulcanisaeta sp. EB80]PLC68449.1 hypothetical protein B7L70_03535 [Vulcanisaeta sp. EB80]
MPTKHKLMIAVSVILLVVVLVIVGATTKAQQPYTQVIMNLLNGQQYFGTPHVYQGDFDGEPINLWPAYYGPNNASQYWSSTNINQPAIALDPVSPSINQPVLELVPALSFSAGAMFWSETYSGGPVKITIIGTFSSGWPTRPSRLFGDGFEIYLFLNPTKWGVSPNYNYSIPYTSVLNEAIFPSPVVGEVIYPQSSTSYLIIQWDPLWQFYHSQPGATGQWNVWVVSNPNGNNPSVGPHPSPNLGYGGGWDGIGTGAFMPSPGDLIEITVTYDPSTNTLSGVAVDLNHTGWEANFTLNLNGYYTPPSSGNYVFGTAGNTGWACADWALLYVAMTYISPPAPTPPPPSPLYVRVVAPSFASWTIYANASTGWYTYYSGSGSASFGPAFPGWPGTSVSLNVSSISDCPSPSVTYEPSNEVTLSNGANYVTVLISCEPMVGVGLNMSYGGGLIMLINKPGLPMTSLILNGPVSNSLVLPVNTTITLIIWPYNGYTLAGLNVNNNTMNYIGTPWGSYIATITITNQTTITITYKQK